MRAFWAVLKRELFAFFVTPLAWVLIIVFLVVQGLHFQLLIEEFAAARDMGDQSPLSAFFGSTVLPYLVMLLLVPPMTMRLFAEERRSGTIETLMTAPVSPAAVVLGKYTAALLTYVVMWAPTALYLVILRRTGEIDAGVAAASYLGVLLIGAGYLAVGLLMSALTRSQFLALIGTALVLLVVFIVGLGEFVLPEGTVAFAVSHHVSPWSQMNELATGVVDTRRLVFDATMIAAPLFFTVRVADAWRWG